MVKRELKKEIIWKVNAECQNTLCNNKGVLNTSRHLVIGEYIECPKCGYHSFKVSRSVPIKK